MVKIFTNTHIFKFPWESWIEKRKNITKFVSVTNVWWQKYPNPHSLQVETADTIDRSLDKSTGELITRRLIAASLVPPSWMQSLGFPSYCYVLEEARVNPKTKEMVLRSVNVTGNSLLQIRETCRYTPCEKNPNEWTSYQQTAEIISGIPLFSTPIEGFSFSVHSSNAVKGLIAMEELCERWAKEGMEGFQKRLCNRLDMVLLMDNIHDIRKQRKS
ncbi:hypothetical protein RFI_09164 [Reticulomyxa filosa]|uniref:PRELI/MSF1 domain-containing protein n=1 Tax=Reticulomyxa filosa TaxID=46433 RepID=X6NNX4_RETFI|nr:hypothetical protein RFI_09164 [Reticulomyxa filosa]|eukprot:ETO27970.1 hypothetical protein RFI_09164 [Reticulomyxa filosa]